MMRKQAPGVLPALLLAALLAAACEQPAGTGGGPEIMVRDAASLAKIGLDPGLPLNGAYVLDADLTLDDWEPLGTHEAPFTGTFDGGGRTITITGASGGLFGHVKGASVRNLKVNVRVVVSTAAGLGAQVGGIAGSAEGSAFENCTAQVVIRLTAHGHNSAAGGIAGAIKNGSAIRSCTARGAITLESGMGEELMVYAGGIAGDGGFGGGVNDNLITRSRWNGAVSASGGYAYCGGIVGYNYSGAAVTLCSAAGTVSARGNNLPYAGGIAAYNSGGQFHEAPTYIEDCYSTADINAESDSQYALAGGIAGANATANTRISRCYSTGAVSVKVAGDGGTETGGTLGVPAAANAGGIAGAQYVGAPLIENCAALNTSLTGEDSASGAGWNIYRIAGAGDSGDGQRTNNVANAAMTISQGGNPRAADDAEAGGKDGADCAARPDQAVYAALGWDFTAVWTMGGDGYPALKWE
ncbi:MAG: hypothetical protein LBQ35_07190 [Spirochaetaceae bacterium]|jgi:hypothetical protein|nr:hypothetical protein [Spirochaetaceae bacterium]